MFGWFSKPRLHDIIKEQDDKKNSYYFLDASKYGDTVVSDLDNLVIKKKMIVGLGITLKIRSKLILKGEITNDGIIQIGKIDKNLVHFDVDGAIENNRIIENYGIVIVARSAKIKQNVNAILYNRGKFENNGSIINAGTIKNTVTFDNHGTILTDPLNGKVLSSINAEFNNKPYSVFDYKEVATDKNEFYDLKAKGWIYV